MDSYAKPTPTSKKPVELIFTVWGPDVSPERETSDLWMDEVEKRTNGRVHFTRCYDDNRDSSVMENSDMTNDCPATGGVTGGSYHLLDIIQTPFIFPNATVSSKVIAQLYAEFQELRDELNDVKVVGLGTGGRIAIFATKAWGPIRTMEALKGAKIRSLPIIDEVIEILGAQVKHVNFMNIGYLLETGELDAAVFGVGLAKTRRWAEQAPYCTDWEGRSLGVHPMRIFMKWDAWNRLPSDIQKVIDELGPAGGDCWFAVKNGPAYDKYSSEAGQYIKEVGGEIITLTLEELKRWIKITRPVRDSATNMAEAMGLPGRKLLDRMLELVEEYSE